MFRRRFVGSDLSLKLSIFGGLLGGFLFFLPVPAIAAPKFYAEITIPVERRLVPGNKVYCGANSFQLTAPFLKSGRNGKLLSNLIAELERRMGTVKSPKARARRQEKIAKLYALSDSVSGICNPSPVNPAPTPIPPTPTPVPPPSVITLPIEVMGADGSTEHRTLRLSAAEAANARSLYLRIHNLSYEGKVSVKINGGPAVALDNQSVEVEPLAQNFGGIGGGFTTIKVYLPLAAGTLVAGDNQISFTFNFTDGVSSGFRVIDLNLLSDGGAALIADSRIVQDDPSQWKPALTAQADIDAGRDLWMNAPLFDPKAGKMIYARCQHCHTTTGFDLKYFNFSDRSIVARSEFHGLTATQGLQIASYIRSLDTVAPGRPWNPPFQPGPGLDAKPVAEWSAGAGIDAVLERDEQMLPYIFPAGIRVDDVRPENNVKSREIPVAFQLPDWNGWLPTVHPVDGFGPDLVPGVEQKNCDSITDPGLKLASQCGFEGIVSNLEKLKAKRPLVLSDFKWVGQFGMYTGSTLRGAIPPPADDAAWTEFDSHRYYSIPQFLMVKNWEIIRGFNLEGTMPTELDPTLRRWIGGQAFATSPRMVGIPRDRIGVRGNSKLLHTYLGWVWYHLQLVLNDGNRSQVENAPIDWGYAYGHIKDLGNEAGLGQTGLFTLWLAKGLQLKNDKTPADGKSKWGLRAGLTPLFGIPFLKSTINTPPAEFAKRQEALTRALIDEMSLYPTDSYFNSPTGSPYTEPGAPGPGGPSLANDFWYAIPVARELGVSSETIDRMIAFASRLYSNPQGMTWQQLKTVPCTRVSTNPETDLTYRRYLVNCESESLLK